MRAYFAGLVENRWLTRAQFPAEEMRNGAGFRWFYVCICGGGVLAVALLISSISTCLAVSRALVIDHLRRDMRFQAGLLEDRARKEAVEASAQLDVLLMETVERSGGRIAWIRVENRDGGITSGIGLSGGQVFSSEEIRTHDRGRQPLFKTINAASGTVLVERLPFRLPAGRPHAVGTHFGGGPPSTIEIAEFWEDANVALGPVQRHLLINSSAAFVLLFALLLIGSRFRRYLRGNELAQQIEIARSVQRDLLPASKCCIDEFEVAGDYVPATEISGDFYDAFSAPGERPAFVLGDVAGKGVPAAVLMGVLHGSVRSACWTESAVHHGEATRAINRLLCERAAANRFVTMFWSYFDPQMQHLKFINAGHCAPLLVKRGRRTPILSLRIGGPVLGVLPDAQFEQGSVRLDAGDCLILYSDGIVEATNAEGEEFGEDRLANVVCTHAEESPEAIRDAILREIQAFTGGLAPDDDRTLVIAAYLGVSSREASDSIAGRASRVPILGTAALMPTAG
jgi:Stage II sporulation protein E (SpoIIE)